VLLKILFIPFSIATGLVAGFVGKKLFELVWGLIEDREAPEPEHMTAPVGKLVTAAAMEGAIFRATRAVADHGSRRLFMQLTGTWPGETEREPE
jgi:uncharacterized protein DUF4235